MSDAPALPSDALITPQAIVAYSCVLIGAGGIVAAFWLGDGPMRSQALIACVAALAGVQGYYLGSSKGSADKDATRPPTA